jgi:hypothetical protein
MDLNEWHTPGCIHRGKDCTCARDLGMAPDARAVELALATDYPFRDCLYVLRAVGRADALPLIRGALVVDADPAVVASRFLRLRARGEAVSWRECLDHVATRSD